ncbi:MAG TPA: hypothetical protein VEA40_17065 [Ramlibacter sp.]|nr:hypothetical protein [Ramlibacter sp.]
MTPGSFLRDRPDASDAAAARGRMREDASPAPSSGRVLVTTLVPQQKTAWTKARADVLQLLRAAGWHVVALPDGLNPVGWCQALADITRLAGAGGQVLIEYPFEQRKRTYLLHMACRARGARLHALLHDLDSLRHADSPVSRELDVLQLFDGLVSHNPAMTLWLREQGYGRKVVNLNLFDYCGPQAPPCHEKAIRSPLKVVFAGNLSYPKARYMYDPRVTQLPGVELSLYGAFFEPERVAGGQLRYMGAFDPDRPALDGRYHFGLVWDGTSIEGCQGNYGEYTRYNNPHKLSLYMALGLPVIAWRQAAIAPFVVDRRVGVLVDDLREIGDLAATVGTGAYLAMAANAARLGEKARRGEFLLDAVTRIAR